MTVKAKCTDCGNKHDLGTRDFVPGTTECPECESKSYRSIPIITSSEKKNRASNASRVTKTQLEPEVLGEIDGVGNTVSESIIRKYSTAESIQQAGVENLCDIDHIGPTVAQRIVDAVS